MRTINVKRSLARTLLAIGVLSSTLTTVLPEVAVAGPMDQWAYNPASTLVYSEGVGE